MRPAHRQAGFTLLELIVAIAIFAVMAAMAYSGLASVLTTRELTDARSSELKNLQMALSVMQRDLTQVVPRKSRDEYGDAQLAVMSGGIAPDTLISFTRTGRPNPGDVPRSYLLRVGYRLEDENLIRTVWVRPDQAPGDTGYEATLLEGVNDVQIRYLNGKDKEWHEDWPPLNASDGFLELPIAVEITLDLENWGELRRLFALPL